MAKVLIATEKPFAAAAVAGIKEVIEGAGNELVLLEKYTEKAQLLEAVADVDAIIIRSDKITAEVLDAAKNLKIVVRAGAGYEFSVCSCSPFVTSTTVRLVLSLWARRSVSLHSVT